MKRIKLSKNTKNALFVFMIAFSAFLAFEPLFEHLGQKAAQEFAAAIFGTIFAAVITMVLLSKQTETEEEKNRSDKVFEQKILLYNQAIDTLQNIFIDSDDGAQKISKKDIMEVQFLLAKMIMIGSEKTIFEFKNFYESITTNYSSETGTVNLSASDKQIIFRFADCCREELGLSSKNIEKDILEDIVIQSELLTKLANSDDFDNEIIDTIKDIYGHLVFDMGIPNKNIQFLPNGFSAYAKKTHNETNCFLECSIDEEKVKLVLRGIQKVAEFETQVIGDKSIIIFRSNDRRKVESHFAVIEKLIDRSFREIEASTSIR